MNATTAAGATAGSESYVDLKRAVGRLLAARWWIAGVILLSTAAFAAIAFLTTPVYRATTVMVPASNDQGGLAGSLGGALGSLGGLASLAGINFSNTGAETEESLAVLRSREFTEAFIRDKQIMPLLFADAWDPATKNWKNPQKPPTLARAYKRFDAGVRSISQDRRTGLVTMTIDWRDRQLAAEWANELVQRLNSEMRARAIAKSSASVGFLEQELQKTPLLGTQEAINRLIEAQIKQRMVASVTHEYAFRVVDRAMLPDLSDKVRPKRLVLLMLGPFVGLFVGIGAVLVLGWLSDLWASLRS
jgi:uncharacterized protein involved in exopolysaccharide biosynthesis